MIDYHQWGPNQIDIRYGDVSISSRGGSGRNPSSGSSSNPEHFQAKGGVGNLFSTRI
jgi:hypothetical protein